MSHTTTLAFCTKWPITGMFFFRGKVQDLLTQLWIRCRKMGRSLVSASQGFLTLPCWRLRLFGAMGMLLIIFKCIETEMLILNGFHVGHTDFFFNGSKYAEIAMARKKLDPSNVGTGGGAVPLRSGSFHHAVLQLWPWLPVISGYFYGMRNIL